jgi:Ca2+-dependent lipid-binding protein
MGKRQSRQNDSPPASREDGVCVVEVIRAENLPNLDLTSLTDAFVVLNFRDIANPKRIVHNLSRSTSTKNNSLNPIFHSYRAFPFVPNENDILSLKVYDMDTVNSNDKVGKVSVPYSELRNAPRMTKTLNLNLAGKSGKEPSRVSFLGNDAK